MNLAYAEMHIIIAGIFRKYDSYNESEREGKTNSLMSFELVEKSRDVVDMAADFAVPFTKAGTKGVRVIVRGFSEGK
jgi:hypothetical protein